MLGPGDPAATSSAPANINIENESIVQLRLILAQHDDAGADLYAVVEVDHIHIKEPDAATC